MSEEQKTIISASTLKKAITEDGKTRKELAAEYGVNLAELEFILKTFNLNNLKAKRKGKAVKAKFDLHDDLKTEPKEVKAISQLSAPPQPEYVMPEPIISSPGISMSDALNRGSITSTPSVEAIDFILEEEEEEMEEIESESGDRN